MTCLYGGLATFFIIANVVLQMIPSPMGPGGLITGCGPALPLYAAAMSLQGVRSIWKRALVFTFVTFAAVWMTLILVAVGLS